MNKLKTMGLILFFYAPTLLAETYSKNLSTQEWHQINGGELVVHYRDNEISSFQTRRRYLKVTGVNTEAAAALFWNAENQADGEIIESIEPIDGFDYTMSPVRLLLTPVPASEGGIPFYIPFVLEHKIQKKKSGFDLFYTGLTSAGIANNLLGFSSFEQHPTDKNSIVFIRDETIVPNPAVPIPEKAFFTRLRDAQLKWGKRFSTQKVSPLELKNLRAAIEN